MWVSECFRGTKRSLLANGQPLDGFATELQEQHRGQQRVEQRRAGQTPKDDDPAHALDHATGNLLATGIMAFGISLHAVTPAEAAILVIFCSVIAQSQTIPTVWQAINFRTIRPTVLAGTIGVPIGVVALAHVNPGMCRIGTGIILVLFSSVTFLGRARMSLQWGRRAADAVVDLGGGNLGGLSGLSGPVTTLWATLRCLTKDHRRGVLQTYNLAVLGLALILQAAAALITAHTLILLLCAFAGVWLGSKTYVRLTDTQFHHTVIALLVLSGIIPLSPLLSGG